MEVGVMQRLQLTHQLQEIVKQVSGWSSFPTNLLTSHFTTPLQCSDRFAGRMELATELDGRVVKLCQILEEVFSHGIRRTSSFKRITRFVVIPLS